jgi:hypothetical protein
MESIDKEGSYGREVDREQGARSDRYNNIDRAREREIEEQRERTEGEKEVGSLGRGERREKSGMGG